MKKMGLEKKTLKGGGDILATGMGVLKKGRLWSIDNTCYKSSVSYNDSNKCNSGIGKPKTR